jgi:hypothetical protein
MKTILIPNKRQRLRNCYKGVYAVGTEFYLFAFPFHIKGAVNCYIYFSTLF